MADGSGIGDRIRELRTGRDPRLTQRELAERAGVSIEVVSKLEQGSKQTALLTTLNKIARALDVDVSALLAAPVRIDDGGDQDAGVLAIRGAVTAVRQQGQPAPLAELSRAAADAWGHYWTHRFDVLGATLPELIRTARATVHDVETPAAHAVLADAYSAAASMLVHLGYVDLAYLTMERAQAAADRSGDELRYSALTGWMSWLLLHQTGSNGEAKHLAMREAERVEPNIRTASPEQISVWGSLLVSAAVAAAREEATAEADELINLAEVAAIRLDGKDRPAASLYGGHPFGTPLVIIQAVDISVVTGRPARALKLAKRMPEETDQPLPDWA